MHILVPFDTEPVSERAVRTALEMFSGHENLRVTAVHVTPREDAPAQLAASEIEAMGAEYGVAVDAEIKIVEHGSESKSAVRKAITDIAETRDIDLVVLGYEEKSVFTRLFQSDTTERMLETRKVPVLLVP